MQYLLAATGGRTQLSQGPHSIFPADRELASGSVGEISETAGARPWGIKGEAEVVNMAESIPLKFKVPSEAGKGPLV